ncbi:MAG TPA: type II toxin-antitoxin system VapC family toxin [Archaeoglobaceae archaeon]|nr:type II toxin-antitoxin system VapC family toxin [Archaeoglobaceae archaeon]
MYLFDTTFVIDLFKQEDKALKKAEEADRTPVLKAISIVTVHEILRGIYYLYEDKKLEEKLTLAESALSKFDIIPYGYTIAKKAAEIDAGLAKSGKMIAFPDVVIAATALAYNLKLVTKNKKHFERIEGLEIESY